MTQETAVDHIDHVCQLAGNARHIGIGSDLDGGYGREQTPSDLGGPPVNPNATSATQVEQDFLAILRSELKRVGAKYRVVVVQNEFDAELPTVRGVTTG